MVSFDKNGATVLLFVCLNLPRLKRLPSGSSSGVFTVRTKTKK